MAKATTTDPRLARMLEAFEHPAIMVAPDYRILATNALYRERFGELRPGGPALCHQVSHGYDVPCDQAGEHCPLAAAASSGRKERVLHIHQTPRGREHVDVELLPVADDAGRVEYFIELLKPVAGASVESTVGKLVGRSAAFNGMLEQIARVGPTEASVLLSGESGTGKELVARAVHESSPRARRPLVTLECAGLTESLFESELFGHARGAFTGANYARQGLAAAADGGSLFLDEIGDVSLPLQVKLLRLLETGVYRPVGNTQPAHTDFRLICATHRDLWAMVEEGSFRQDLYYRINVFPLRVPTLAERVEDIPLISETLLATLSPKAHYHLTQDAMELLQSVPYRGNIRELRNVLARALVLTNGNVIDREVAARCLEHRPQATGARTAGAPTAGPLPDLRTLERDYLQQLLARFQGDKAAVARAAGISLRTLYRKLGSPGEGGPAPRPD